MTTSRASTKPPRVWDDPRIRLPDAEAWAALDEAAQDAHVEAIVAVLDEYREAMSEGTRHVRRKVGAAADRRHETPFAQALGLDAEDPPSPVRVRNDQLVTVDTPRHERPP